MVSTGRPDGVLYFNATLITVNQSRDVISDGAILVQNGVIKAIGKTSEIISEFGSPQTVISCSNRIIIPGLINTHAHLAQSLLRGLAEDLPLHSWLCDAIWPLEASYQDNDGYVAARLTIAEMLKSGTTCFLEAMLTHGSGIENVVRAVGELGVRACLGKLIKTTETNANLKLNDARDKDVASMSIEAALMAYKTYHGHFNDRLHIWFAAGTPRGSPVSAHAAIGSTAHEYGIGMTMHCAEAPADRPIFHSEYNCSPLEFCKKAQLTSKKTVLAHVVHPDPNPDFEIMRESGTTVSHNPTSNCKLGSGISPIPDMIKANVNVSLGTDGAPCNNTYDMFREMHLAAILHSGARESAGLITAYDVLEMATINGARALGLAAEIGSLEIGKKADFVVVNPDSADCAPWDPNGAVGGMDPITLLVHGCTGTNVEKVVIDGIMVVDDGELLHANEKVIIKQARDSIAGIKKRSGIGARNHMNINYI
ncbi:5-methylthioadenosine/S-adenosylhomocysteine deaminase n1 [Microthyrium microscopicum]|uniref:5-methylthioadenosine/S-adenosylhomocysteine deaminase n1 n=1 Tax=Microthyrium microscopicum TaxID=703497 RepID=A0A6A6TWG9_9PEZI|nr:5-methylthioadenosine/S-adenosylhomocysteine deaminase n1 [Microthyrium microscopicum]